MAGVLHGFPERAECHREGNRQQRDRGQHLDQGEAVRTPTVRVHGRSPFVTVTAPVNQSAFTRNARCGSLKVT
jgi:hypothetical protein